MRAWKKASTKARLDDKDHVHAREPIGLKLDLTPTELLRKLGQRGILTLPERKGGVTTLLCDMDVCYCPYGRGYFDLKTHPPKAWDPSLDHDPDLKMDGGHRVKGNVRLAHILCNNLAFGDGPGHEKKRRKAAEAQAKWHEEHPEESLRHAGNRAAAEAQWESLRAARSAEQRQGGL